MWEIDKYSCLKSGQKKMAVKTQKMHDGKLYYTTAATARMLETTTTKLKSFMIEEGFEWTTLPKSSGIWISATSITEYLRRKEKG